MKVGHIRGREALRPDSLGRPAAKPTGAGAAYRKLQVTPVSGLRYSNPHSQSWGSSSRVVWGSLLMAISIRITSGAVLPDGTT